MGGTRRHRKGRNCNLDMLFEGKKIYFQQKGTNSDLSYCNHIYNFMKGGKITFDCSNLRKTGKSIF